MSRSSGFASLFALAILTSPASASWSHDPAVPLPICSAPGSQTLSRVVSDQAGGMIVVWNDPRALRNDIYAQRVSGSGSLLWPTNGVPLTTPPAGGTDLLAVSDGAGGMIVGWLDFRATPDFYVQRVAPDGTLLWDANGVRLGINPSCCLQYEALVPDGASGAILAWAEQDNAADYIIIPRARRIDSNGAVQWPSSVSLTSADVGDPGDFTAAPDGFGGAIIGWAGSVQRIDHDGALLWGPDGITGPSGNVAILGDGAGGAWLGWHDPNGITLRRLNPDGSARWTTSIASSYDPSLPVIIRSIGDDIVVGWSGDRPVPTLDYRRLYAQRLDASGAIHWQSPGVLLADSTRADGLTGVTDEAGGALFAWTFNAVADPVSANRVDAGGTPWPRWTRIGPGGSVSDIGLAVDGHQGALLAWSRRTASTPKDIFGQRVRYSGELADSTVVAGAATGVPAPLRLGLRALSNPVTNEIAAAIMLPRAERVTLTLTDIAGRRVARRVLEPSAGEHRVSLGVARDYGPGVYFLGLDDGSAFRTIRVCIVR